MEQRNNAFHSCGKGATSTQNIGTKKSTLTQRNTVLSLSNYFLQSKQLKSCIPVFCYSMVFHFTLTSISAFCISLFQTVFYIYPQIKTVFYIWENREMEREKKKPEVHDQAMGPLQLATHLATSPRRAHVTWSGRHGWYTARDRTAVQGVASGDRPALALLVVVGLRSLATIPPFCSPVYGRLYERKTWPPNQENLVLCSLS